MMGLGLAFLVLLALAGTASAKAKAGPVGPVGPDLGPLPIVTPGPPDPKIPTNTTTGPSGTTWITQAVRTAIPMVIDVFLPDGQMGSHPTFRVLRFSVGAPPAVKTLMETVPGVAQSIVDLAIKDFSIVFATTDTPVDFLPTEWQQKIAEALKALTVDPATGKITGPVNAAAVQLATALASDLERAGYAAAAATLRAFAKAAASLVPNVPDNKKLPIPGLPADMVDQVNRALSMERDPAKLRAIVTGLKTLPQSSERDHAIATLEALIIQIEADKAAADALAKIKKVVVDPQPPQPAQPAQSAQSARPTTGGQYTVQPSDSRRGASGVAAMFTGDGNRWRELQTVNRNHDLTKQFWVGMVLNLPANWPSVPPGRTATPGMSPSTVAPAGGATYIISTTDGIGPKGPSFLAAHYTGNGSRWRDLIPMNPSKKLNPQGTNFAHWYAGETIHIPQSWLTASPAPIATGAPAPAAPIMSTDSLPVAQPLPEPKSAVEIAAANMIRNMRDVQASRGPRAFGKEDQNLVKRFQTLAGMASQDGVAGMATMVAAARAGQSSLPFVMYWPKSTSSSVSLLVAKVMEYRNALNALAAEARAAGLDTRAIELQQSAERELAQSDKRGPVSI